MTTSDASGHYACVHSARCGGCTLLQRSLGDQLARKHRSVVEALEKYRALRAVPAQPVRPAAPMLGYRTRAKLVVSPQGAIGLYARGSHEVLDIPHCRVMHPALLEVVADVRAQTMGRAGGLTGLDARLLQGGSESIAGGPAAPAREAGVLLTLIGDAAAEPTLREHARALARHRWVRGIALRLQAAAATRLLEGATTTVAGTSVVREQLRSGGPYHYVTFGSFVQAHAGQAAAMATHVIELLQGRGGTLRGQRVLELYAGSGALGLELAAQGANVCAVEKFAPALEFAEQAGREQGLTSLRCRVGDADEVAHDCARRGQRYEAVIVNPPRRGLSLAVREAVAVLSPRCIVYISCEPTTLARDLSDFAMRGWAVTHVQPFDMIPLSSGVETVVTLEPAAPPPIEVLHEDAQLLIVDKPPHLPTTPDPAHVDSLLQRLQREHALPELTALHRLDVGTSGVCLFAKERSAVHELSQRLREGEKHYLALVVGATRAKGIVRAAMREQGKTRPAVSRYTRVSREGVHSLVRVRPQQGRTHQVRKHMAAIGHPLLGDARYGDGPSNRFFEHRHGLDRAFLHASRVVFAARDNTAALCIEAPLAPDLAAVLHSVREG